MWIALLTQLITLTCVSSFNARLFAAAFVEKLLIEEDNCRGGCGFFSRCKNAGIEERRLSLQLLAEQIMRRKASGIFKIRRIIKYFE